jgi:para-nitrobenzyl esterase
MWKSLILFTLLLTGFSLASVHAQSVETTTGYLEGMTTASGIQAFKGIPYAKPPVRDRRWKPPEPADEWAGIRQADRFGPRCMQPRSFGDMIFRSGGMSEDCLYLNVWTPSTETTEERPVLVYFYGGGFLAGDGSEPRYDGESMAREGIVVVTVNYRLGVFGFMAHPELAAESPEEASGNYGLLDQALSLRWVQENIRAFGGDPEQVTIGGESAGSMSVSAHMISPRSKNRFARAIGESGSVLGYFTPSLLPEAEKQGVRFMKQVGAESLSEMRSLSSTRLLEWASKPSAPYFDVIIDGSFLAHPPLQAYSNGEQATVPLMVGWNSEEGSYRSILDGEPPIPEVYEAVVREIYGEQADRALELYPAETWQEVIQVGTALASDRFMGYSTWKWSELHRRTEEPVYRYFYTHPRPPMKPNKSNNVPGLAGSQDGPRLSPPQGAVHSAEIEYALGNLETNDIYAWTPADHTVSAHMKSYFANFIKTGDPNGTALPSWPATNAGEHTRVMRLNTEPRARRVKHRARYQFLDSVSEN